MRKNNIENTEINNDFHINYLSTKNFMSLKNDKVIFSKGINLVIGENGSGKTQILKLLYGIIDANNEIELEKEKSIKGKQRILANSLRDVFKPEKLGNLVRKKETEAEVCIDFNSYKTSFKFGSKSEKAVSQTTPFTKKFIEKASVFIPAKEVLSFFPGFRTLYEKKYLEFDKCYYNLCRSLEEPLSKSIDNGDSKIVQSLETILEGKVEIINGKFYLIKDDNTRYEIHLVAEGLRKISLLSYLLRNETLSKNGILFWDEPESNINPKLVREIVRFLVALSNNGMQIFLATHSPYVIESLNNHLKKYKIRDLKTDNKEISNIEPLNPQNTTAYLLKDGSCESILNVELGLLDDNLLHSFNDINILYDKMKDIEWEEQND